MSDEATEKRLIEIERQGARTIRLLGEVRTLMVTASAQIVGLGEANHGLLRRVDGILDDADEDSKKTGANQIQVTSKQETLLDIQIKNALADSAAKTRTFYKDWLQIGLSLAAAIGVILAFIKFYVHTP